MACCASCTPQVGYMGGMGDARGCVGAMGDTVAPECEATVLVPYFWNTDVDALKKRLEPQLRATDIGVKSCAGLAPEERAAWDLFYRTTLSYLQEPTPFWGAGGEWARACSVSRVLSGWQTKLRTSCAIPGPVDVPKHEEQVSSTVKYAAVAAIAVALVYGVTRALK